MRLRSITRIGPTIPRRTLSRSPMPRWVLTYPRTSILEPSATINGRFFQTKFTLKNGEVVTGSVVEVADKKIMVAPVMMNPQATVEISQADVKSEEPSSVSAMPPGLLSEFTKEEVVELMAFLDAGGDRTAAVYRKK